MGTSLKNVDFAIRAMVRTAGLALGMGAITAQASISFIANGGNDYTATASGLGQTIPDNNPSGVAYDLNFGASGLSVANITVSLNISGGYNGDLYAYLSSPGGSVLVLLDRVGVSSSSTYGYGDAGFNNVLLSDGGSVNIHAYGGNGGNPVTGTYLADGQTVSPFASPSSFNANGGSLTFNSQFAGSNPNGDWTLFFADASAGSVSTLNGFTVDMTAVPEPVNVALGIFGGLGVLWWAVGLCWKKPTTFEGEPEESEALVP